MIDKWSVINLCIGIFNLGLGIGFITFGNTIGLIQICIGVVFTIIGITLITSDYNETKQFYKNHANCNINK